MVSKYCARCKGVAPDLPEHEKRRERGGPLRAVVCLRGGVIEWVIEWGVFERRGAREYEMG